MAVGAHFHCQFLILILVKHDSLFVYLKRGAGEATKAVSIRFICETANCATFALMLLGYCW